MHGYNQANFHLHVNRKPYMKCLVKLSAKAPATSHKWPSYVRGYHQYKSDWLSIVVRETPRLATELNNRQDPFAVAVIKYGCVVGHIPRTISQTAGFSLGLFSVVLRHATFPLLHFSSGLCWYY